MPFNFVLPERASVRDKSLGRSSEGQNNMFGSLRLPKKFNEIQVQRRSLSARPPEPKQAATLSIATDSKTFAEQAKKRRSHSLGPDDRLIVEKLQDNPS